MKLSLISSKKTVEFSKNNSTVEDFAAYVVSNFSLKLNNSPESGTKYNKQKPSSEDVQQHFKKFLPDKDKEEHLKAVKTLIKSNNPPSISLSEFNELSFDEPKDAEENNCFLNSDINTVNIYSSEIAGSSLQIQEPATYTNGVLSQVHNSIVNLEPLAPEVSKEEKPSGPRAKRGRRSSKK